MFKKLFERLLWFKKKRLSDICMKEICSERVDILSKYVNKTIELHYINQDIEKIETAELKYPPTEESFYVGNDASQHIIHWDRTDTQGRRDFVKLIKDKNGNIIYENNSVPFDYSKINKDKIKNGF